MPRNALLYINCTLHYRGACVKYSLCKVISNQNLDLVWGGGFAFWVQGSVDKGEVIRLITSPLCNRQSNALYINFTLHGPTYSVKYSLCKALWEVDYAQVVAS